MKFSYNWLKELINLKQSPKETAEILTFLGFETAISETKKLNWDNVVTAKVIEVNKHPNADKLTLCRVSDGKSDFSIICGDPNVQSGQIIPLAKIGAELPNGLKISKAKIRGVESEGMICSEKELGLSNEAQGIMIFSNSTPIGKPIEQIISKTGTILEIEIPTNRPDCLGHIGIAREISAKLKKPIKPPKILKKNTSKKVKISIKDKDLCYRYIGCQISGVKIHSSPDWLAQRLINCGIRPINNIVDITNYVLLEMGHPLHAFDIDYLAGHEIIVRRALSNEKMLGLDGKEYKLNNSILVIADSSSPQAIGGVIGGEHSGVTEKTQTIILESAVFSPPNIRKTSKTLSISTESSYRFERGTSWEVCEMASWRAVNLILELCGGKLEARTDCIGKKYMPLKVNLRPNRTNQILNLKLSNKEMKDILHNLGLANKESSGKFQVSIPSYRLDLTQEADLIEEIARIKGYENIPVTVPSVSFDIKEGKKEQTIENILRERLTSLGFCETINHSFCEEKNLKEFNLPVIERIGNPLSKENEVLRSSLLPLLYKNFILNIRQGYESINLFETGIIFASSGEKKSLGILVYGPLWQKWWGWENKNSPQKYDFNILKGVINNIFAGNNLTIKENEKCSSFYHPGKTALLEINGKAVGEFGIINPRYYTNLLSEIGYAEFDLNQIDYNWNRRTIKYEHIKKHPPVKRDLSFLVNKDTSFDKIANSLNEFVMQNQILREFHLFDKFEDSNKLGHDKISYSFHFIFRHSEHTLTDHEVNEHMERIIKHLENKLSISLR